MYIFKTSGETYSSVIGNQKHAFLAMLIIHLPSRAIKTSNED